MRVGITGRGGCAAKNRIAVEAAPAAIILTVPGGEIQFANAAQELVGQSIKSSSRP